MVGGGACKVLLKDFVTAKNNSKFHIFKVAQCKGIISENYALKSILNKIRFKIQYKNNGIPQIKQEYAFCRITHLLTNLINKKMNNKLIKGVQ